MNNTAQKLEVASGSVKKPISKLWLGIFGVLTVVGIVAWVMQLTQGLQLTNLTTANMWGLYIVGFMLFTGVAAGALFFAALPFLFKLEAYKPYAAVAAYLAAIASIVAASLFIIVDIGNPERAWFFITSGNFTSPMFWDFIILLAYMVISVIFTRQLLMLKKGKIAEKGVKPIAIVAFVAGILVTITSFVFCLQISRPLWNSPVQPLSFLIVALIAALVVLIVLAVILNKSGYLKMPPNLLANMGKLIAVLLVAELIIAAADVVTGLYPGGGEHFAAISWLVSGAGALGFWLEIVAIVAAIILLSNKAAAKNTGLLLIGALVALVAIYLIKSNLLQAQLFNPLLTYPGPLMGAGGMMEVGGTYFPSLIEWGVSIGILALGALLMMVGLNKLDLGEK